MQVWDVLDSKFEKNFAKEMGGGVSGINGADMTVVNSTFYGNSAYRKGGALHMEVRSSCRLYLNGLYCFVREVSFSSISRQMARSDTKLQLFLSDRFFCSSKCTRPPDRKLTCSRRLLTA